MSQHAVFYVEGIMLWDSVCRLGT